MNPLDLAALQDEESNKQLYLPKSLELANNLFQAFIIKNNVVGLKIALFLSGAKSQITYSRDNKVVLSVDELCKVCNFDKRELSRNISKAIDTKFKYVNKENLVGETHPIHSYEYKNKNKDIILEISSLAKEIFNELGKGGYSFSKADANNIMGLKHKHSVRMQLLLEQINNFTTAKRKEYSLEVLNHFFGVRYRSYYDFEQKILLPVKTEIDDNSKLTFLYDFKYEQRQGTGRPKIIGIQIDLKEQGHIQGRLL